jgi:hypothetical protein
MIRAALGGIMRLCLGVGLSWALERSSGRVVDRAEVGRQM